MKSIVLATAIKILVPVFQVFSLYILFRGHNHPGGGFIGGLVAAIALVFYVMTYGPRQTFRTLFEFKIPRLLNKDRRTQARRSFHIKRLNSWRRHKANSKDQWQHLLFRVEPMYLIGAGLLVAASSGVVGFLFSEPYMSALWADFYIPVIGRPGTPILLDLGVYLLVMGIVLKITFVLSEE